jgi:hypothetical protein
MVEVPEVARPRSGSGPLALSETRRAWNRSRITPVSEIRCECTRPNCRNRTEVRITLPRWQLSATESTTHLYAAAF